MFSREQMQRAIEDALKQMEGVALELYRRGREEARDELEQVTRERNEARASVADAYRRGAEAMREACADRADGFSSGASAKDMLDLPIPGEP
jgi:hypothetical protein